MSKFVVRTLGITALLSLFANLAVAAPLFTYSVLASPNQNGPYSSNLVVQPGHSYFYEVVGKVSPIGTTNTHTNGTINSQSAADGANSLSLTVLDSGSNPIQVSFNSAALALLSTTPASAADWNGAPGFNPGTITSVGGGTSNEVLGARPIHAAGMVTGGLVPDVLLIGSFSVPNSPLASGLTSLLTVNFAGTASTFKYNSGANTAFVSSTTEASSDPFLGFSPLTLTTASVPEPSTFVLGLGGMGALVMWAVRRRKVS